MSTQAPPTEDPLQAAPKDDLRIEHNIKWITRNGIGIQIMDTLAVGAFLTAFALQLGASNLMIGILAAIPHLSQLAQIPATYAVERLRKRRRIYSISGWVARPMLLVIGFAAFLPGSDALKVIMAAFFVRYLAGAFLSCSWNSWMRDLVPENLMGKVFGRRQKIMTGVGVLLTLIAAGFVDSWSRFFHLDAVYAYTIIYTLAFMGGIYGVWAARKIDEPAMEPLAEKIDIVAQLRAPFHDRNYRRLISFLASWNFAVNLAAPFFTVHMLRKMGLDLIVVMGLATLSQITAYMMVAQWGHIADRFSNKSVLAVCAPLFVLAIFTWTFTTMPETHALTLPLLFLIHMATGAASAGVTLASGNLTLKLAPRGKATGYLAANSMVNALAAGSASMIGGLTADFFQAIELSVIFRWVDTGAAREFSAFSFTNWDFFFLFATVFGLYALHRLSLVEEHGDVQERVVLDTLVQNARQGLRNLSTVSGLRAASDFPITSLIGIVSRRKKRQDNKSIKEPAGDTQPPVKKQK